MKHWLETRQILDRLAELQAAGAIIRTEEMLRRVVAAASESDAPLAASRRPGTG
jgi:hypothetical protein